MAEPLLPRVAAGELAAVNECIARYGGLVWSLAKRKSRNLADAEDAVQEIFVDLWRSASRFDPEVASEVTFVTVISRRRLIDRQRKQLRQIDPGPLAESESPVSEDSSARIELCDEARRASQHLDTLRPEERRVLELSIYHGLSHSRIAQEVGLPLGTVKSHARRGLSSLREKLRSEEHPMPDRGLS